MSSAVRRPAGSGGLEALALAAFVLGLWLLRSRHLGRPSADFDEGVYLASASALAHGAHLGTEVFASQPPLFFEGLTLAWNLTGGGSALIRGLALLIAVAGCGIGYAMVRPMAGAIGGLSAVLLLGLAFSPEGGVVQADIPCVVLGLAGLAVGERASRHAGWAFAAGGLVTAGVLVKLLALPFVPGLAALVVCRRWSRKAIGLMICGVLAVGAAALSPHIGDLSVLWQQAVGFPSTRRPGISATSLMAEISEGHWVPAALLVVAVATVALNPPTSWRHWMRERATILTVLVAGLLFLMNVTPLYSHHLVVASAPLALLAASACPKRWPVALGIGAAVVAGLAVTSRDLLSQKEVDAIGGSAALVRAGTRPAEPVVSDLPLVPLAAGRTAVAATIDSSVVRVKSGSLSRGGVLAASRHAGAVVIGRSYAYFGNIKPQLRGRFPFARHVEFHKGGITVWLRRRVQPEYG
jgi:hypothetical protein